jgi:hypothetical protein
MALEMKTHRYMKRGDVTEVFCRALWPEFADDPAALLDEWEAFSEEGWFHDYRALGGFIAKVVGRRSPDSNPQENNNER